jgi:hypothetical protein
MSELRHPDDWGDSPTQAGGDHDEPHGRGSRRRTSDLSNCGPTRCGHPRRDVPRQRPFDHPGATGELRTTSLGLGIKPSRRDRFAYSSHGLTGLTRGREHRFSRGRARHVGVEAERVVTTQATAVLVPVSGLYPVGFPDDGLAVEVPFPKATRSMRERSWRWRAPRGRHRRGGRPDYRNRRLR